MPKAFATCLFSILPIISAGAQVDTIRVGTINAVAGKGTVSVPVYLSNSAGYCLGHFAFAWSAENDRIKSVGIAPGNHMGWRFSVESIDNDRGVISVVGENTTPESMGPAIPFCLVFAIENPEFQNIPIGSNGPARLDCCDGIGMFEAAFVPGELRLMANLPGDVNGSGFVSGIDVTHLVDYLSGSRNSLANPASGDANGDCETNALDVSYLVNYFEGRGSQPVSRDCQ
jgi:hypothetical protein